MGKELAFENPEIQEVYDFWVEWQDAIGSKEKTPEDFERNLKGVWRGARATGSVPEVIRESAYSRHMALYAVLSKMTNYSTVDPGVLGRVVVEVMNHLEGKDQYLSDCVVTKLLRKELIRVWRLSKW